MIIYKATNKINGKCYIGQTKHSLEERKRVHLTKANQGIKTHFYQAIRKYGADNFEWEILCVTNSKSRLNELETYYITYYDSIKHGYNMVDGGDNNIMDIESVKTKHDRVMQSEEVRSKISKTMKEKVARGELFTEEHRRRLSESAKGNHNFGSGDTRSIGCYCILSDGKCFHFHSYRDAWKWWSNNANPFDSNTECVYQRKIKQSISNGYFIYKNMMYEYPKWYREESDSNVKVD